MARVFYVHWDKEEAAAGARGLREGGHSVRYEAESGDAVFKEVKKSPPDALVVSLTKQPSHGQRVAMAVRGNKSLKDVPVIFVGGEDEKVAEVRKKVPEATYCSWAQLRDRISKVTKPKEAPGADGEAVKAGAKGRVAKGAAKSKARAS